MPFCLSGTIQGLDKQFPAHLWIKSFTQVMKGRSGWNVAGELMENPIFKSFLFRIVFVCAKTFWPFSCLQKRVSSYFFSADNLIKQFLNGPFSGYFSFTYSLFKQTKSNFYNKCEKCPSSSRCWDSNLRSLVMHT